MLETQMFANEMPPEANSFATQRPAFAAPRKCQVLAKKGLLSAKNLTKEVVLLLHSAEFQLGVLLHLGEFSSAKLTGTEFAEAAGPMILQEFASLGVRAGELAVYVVGGSPAHARINTSEVAIRRMLWNWGLTLTGSDLGGHQARSVWMDVASGRLIIRSKTARLELGVESDSLIQPAC